MTADIRHIEINGARLGYAVHSEDSGRPAAIFVAGYSGRSTGEDAYPELIAALSERFTIYGFDLRAHGASAEATDGFSMTAVADDVATFVQELKLDRPFYIGHSFGGFTGLYCEVRHPGTFGAICLITTASAEGGGFTPPEITQLMVEHGGDEGFMRTALAGMYVRGGDTTRHARTAAQMDPSIHAIYFEEYRERIIIKEVRSIRCPVLAVNGALDTVVPLATQHATALALPRCKEVILTNEGHMLPVESPATVAREIFAFWDHDRHDLGAAPDRTLDA